MKAVLSTSDSWPHIDGIRFAVSQSFPVFILDAKRPGWRIVTDARSGGRIESGKAEGRDGICDASRADALEPGNRTPREIC